MRPVTWTRLRRRPSGAAVIIVVLCAGIAIAAVVGPPQPLSLLADRFERLTRDSRWTLVSAVPLQFPIHHPQGMVKIGATIYVSSVEVTQATKRAPAPIEGLDRTAGEGIGHLFKVDLEGRLLADLRLGEGSVYHPGGIDYDGRYIWVPVAEYRPNSRSIVYRVDPATMKPSEVLRFPDHLGAIVHDTDGATLRGVSWGSRRFYRWPLDGSGRMTSAAAAPESIQTLNRSHYVDYQDCHDAGDQRMLCSGVSDLRGPGGAALRLGGIDLIDLRDGRPLHQVPVPVWTPTGRPITQNPVWLEPTATGLRGYFIPDDGRATLYVYDID